MPVAPPPAIKSGQEQSTPVKKRGKRKRFRGIVDHRDKLDDPRD